MTNQTNHSSTRLLDIRGLKVSFQSAGQLVKAVQSVSLNIRAGESVGLVGESGSGKSVTASSVLKLLPENKLAEFSGEIFFESNDLLKFSDDEIRRVRGNLISMIFQEPMSSLNPLHDVRRQIAEVMYIHKKFTASQIIKRVKELLELVELKELSERRVCYPHQISGGQQQRVMIAMALANNPKLIIADEPTTALDVTVTEQIMSLLKRLQEETGVALLFITHDLGIIHRFCERVYVMKNGEIVESGDKNMIFKTPKHPYTLSLVKADELGNKKQSANDNEKEILSVKNLNVKFSQPGKFFSFNRKYAHILHDLSFTVKEGKTLGIVGESGSGKSTLAKAVLKLIPYSGDIYLLEKNMATLGKAELRRFRRYSGLVSQDPLGSLSPKMQIHSIVSEGLRMHHPGLTKATYEEKLNQALKEMNLDPGLHKNRYPFEFSGGQRQRISIARSIIYGPKFIILDEPTSALDKTIQAKILELLNELQKKMGLTYLFISHDLKVIRAVSDEILVLNKGEIVEFGKTEDIFNDPQHPYTKKLLTSSFFTK